eukprot:2501536-Prymnesium_polylepis.2
MYVVQKGGCLQDCECDQISAHSGRAAPLNAHLLRALSRITWLFKRAVVASICLRAGHASACVCVCRGGEESLSVRECG